MARKITCRNEDNVQMTFGGEFNPWLLQSCEGIYEARNKVTTSENTMNNGSTFQGSNALQRNIVMVFRDRPESDHQENRNWLYTLFKPRSKGVFIYQEDETIRTIEYYVESVVIDSAKRSRAATVSLLCPNPFFEALDDTTVSIAGWSGHFEWPHEFLDAGEEFGSRSEERLASIDNSSAADGIGLKITIEADGAVTNPTVNHIEQGIEITVGTDSKPLNLKVGDRLIITTHTNNKHVYLVRDGNQTEINEYLTEDSEFIQLMRGANTIGYSAGAGVEYITLSISYRYQYMGV